MECPDPVLGNPMVKKYFYYPQLAKLESAREMPAIQTLPENESQDDSLSSNPFDESDIQLQVENNEEPAPPPKKAKRRMPMYPLSKPEKKLRVILPNKDDSNEKGMYA